MVGTSRKNEIGEFEPRKVEKSGGVAADQRTTLIFQDKVYPQQTSGR